MDELISRHIETIFRVLAYRREGKATGNHHGREKFHEGLLHRQVKIIFPNYGVFLTQSSKLGIARRKRKRRIQHPLD